MSPPTWKLVLTAEDVLLIASEKVPVNTTPGTSSVTVPVTLPANPAFVIKSAPDPPVRRT